MVRVTLNERQLDVLAAAARGEVYRHDRPPYTAHRKGQPRAITQTVDGLIHRNLFELGHQDGGRSYYKPSDAGCEALRARGRVEENQWRGHSERAAEALGDARPLLAEERRG